MWNLSKSAYQGVRNVSFLENCARTTSVIPYGNIHGLSLIELQHLQLP